jgi:hypothetical protein
MIIFKNQRKKIYTILLYKRSKKNKKNDFFFGRMFFVIKKDVSLPRIIVS